MYYLFKLAWRNIWRNKRRSFLTFAAITFATFAAVAMRGMQIGTYSVNIKNAVEVFAGYLQIQRTGYQKNPSLNLAFKYEDELKDQIESNKNIVSFSPRVLAAGLISFQDNSYGTSILGIDPKNEIRTTNIMSKINSGKFFEEKNSLEVVIGEKLAKNLKVSVGEKVVVLSQGYDGSLGNLKFTVTGTIKTGSPELDQMAVFMGIETAQELLSMYGNRIHSIVIKLDDINQIRDVQGQLASEINSPDIDVLTWEEIMPDFKQSIELDNISGILMLLILVIIVAFGILNTVLMSVTERFHEFGVILAIGMPQIKLVTLVFIETIFISVIGILIGDIIGIGINYYIVHNPIEFGSEFAYVYEEYGFLPRIESSLSPFIFFNTTFMILLISVIACLYPLYKVFKLESLKGIRYT